MLARKIHAYYEFDCRYDEATIGDVLQARNGRDAWDFVRAKRTHSVMGSDGVPYTIKKGGQRTTIPLPDLYTNDEWKRISKFNFNTTKLVHSGELPRSRSGRPFIIIPHSEFSQDMVSFLQNIGVRGWLFDSPQELEVKDEETVFLESV
uniref:Uncharacterized protein n=1 Tax=Spongospora subterranea TaxID=70186 RepID=A0A0H5QX57_9EUKA|eukprot:CRZ06307.1 hypothetical protein [Spongospora subterranea]